MSPEPNSLMERVIALTRTARDLGKLVRDLQVSIEDLTRRAKLAERFITIISISLLLDISLTVAVVLLAWSNYSTNNRVDTICPLYSFILGTYAPQSRAAGSDRDQYVAAFSDMRLKFAQLGCGPDYPIVPGAAHPPTAFPGN